MALQDPKKSAGIYAWEYFKYHAGQRQAVFRFYLTLIGVATVAYAYSRRFPSGENGSIPPAEDLKSLVGAIYIVTSFLFWSLDKRSQRLIKLAEEALKKREADIASSLEDNSIKLMSLGDIKSERFPLSELESFRQVYGCIFLLIGIIGAFLAHQYLGYVAVAIALIWYVRSLIRRYLKTPAPQT